VLSTETQNYQNTVLENVLYNASGFAEASATKMEILFHYLRLSFVPWPLSWDYSYNQIPLVNWNSPVAWIGLLLYGGMLGFATLNIKKKPAISFGIFFYLIMLAPTANFFFLIGATLSERFLFFPLLGFVIAVVFWVAHLLKLNVSTASGSSRNKFLAIFCSVSVLFAIMTISRAVDWKSNVTIFESGAENAPNSSRTNSALGNKYRILAEQESNPQLKTVYFNDAIKFSKRSLDILPSNKDALYNIALTYQVMHNFAEAKKAFQNVLKYYPDFKSAFNNLGSIFIQENNFDSAYFYIKRCYDLDSSVPKSSQNLAIYYFQTSDFQQSIKFAQNAIRLNPNMKISYEILIKIYQNEGNTAERDKYQRLYREMLASTTEENSELVE
jgi:tetratricopeptide (TPR) repeat protein